MAARMAARRCIWVTVVSVLLVGASSTRGLGRPPAGDQQTQSSCFPVRVPPWCEHGFRLHVGAYNASFCNITAWTYRDLWFGEEQILSPTGFTTTVANVNIKPNTAGTVWPPVRAPACPVIRQSVYNTSGFLGTGHGGEYVFAVTLHGAGQAYSLLPQDADALRARRRTERSTDDVWSEAPPMPSGGIFFPINTTLSVVKDSQIGPFLMRENTTLSPTGLSVSVNGTVVYANSGQLVNFLYPAMTMFSLPFTEWIAATSNDTRLSGRFLHDDSFTLMQNIRWAAVFAPSATNASVSSLGAVYEYPVGHAYDGYRHSGNFFWNRNYDHKLYFKAKPSDELGSSFAFQHHIQAFRASAADWQASAEALVQWPKGRR